MKKFTTQEIRDLFNQVMHEEISFSEMVEMINERVSKANEPQYKDGDFVVNICGVIIIFKNKIGDYIYDHAYFVGAVIISDTPSIVSIERHATEEEKKKMLDALAKAGKRWNEEKKCIEDIPKRKFKSGDKVRIKEGVSSRTHHEISPYFPPEMDDLIGKTMTVNRYTDWDNYVNCYESGFLFPEDWLEPYEELKKGDLAIFWQFDKTQAVLRLFDSEQGGLFQIPTYVDNNGHWWNNAIKFESKEQFEKLIKGEI